jgi:hypothetical protein
VTCPEHKPRQSRLRAERIAGKAAGKPYAQAEGRKEGNLKQVGEKLKDTGKESNSLAEAMDMRHVHREPRVGLSALSLGILGVL